MLRRILANLRFYDWPLLLAVLMLVLISLLTLYSIGLSFDQPDFTNFNRQLVFGGIGLVVLIGISMIDYRFWQNISRPLYLIGLTLLVGVLIFGQNLRGTKGWFIVGSFSFQPVEIAKFGLIAWLAYYLARHGRELTDWRKFLTTGVAAAAASGLVILQPDLGSAIVLFVIWFALVMLAGVRRWHIASVVGMLIVVFISGWFFFFADYQKDRLLTFVDPGRDPYGTGYHVRQALIAVGAGQLTGKGLSFGSQSQLKFIPDSQTDFIFAVISEELGFLGAGLVLVLWGIIFWRLLRIAKHTSDDFALFFVMGVFTLFFVQTTINIGMNIGLLPVTGIGLPFISYGGSFLIVSLALIGVVQDVAIKSVRHKI